MSRDNRWGEWENDGYQRGPSPPYYEGPYRNSPPRGPMHYMEQERMSREQSPTYDSIFDMPCDPNEMGYESPGETPVDVEFGPPRKFMRYGPHPDSGPMGRGRGGHPNVQRTPKQGAVPLCAFFSEGRCHKGADCLFSHYSAVCRFYQKGACNKGKKCPFSHNIKAPPVKKEVGPVVSKTSTTSASASKVPTKKSTSVNGATTGKKAKPTIQLMRAIRVTRFGCPTVMEIEKDIAVPKPSNTQILIKVAAAGINPVDAYIRAGTFHKLPALPYTPGNDAAGIVQTVGKDVKEFKVGDRVFTLRTTTGAYAEFALAEADYTFQLHESLTLQQGAGLGISYFTAYRALFIRGNAKPGETVLIHGASGGVGLAACQTARAHGLRVFGTAGSSLGLDLVKENGASASFNHTAKAYTDQIKAATDGRGVDLIIEMMANVNLVNDLAMLAPKGRVMVVGSHGKLEIDPQSTMNTELDIRGVMLWGGTQEEFKQIGTALYAAQESGWLRPVIGNEFGLDEAPDAHTEIIRLNHTTEGKMVLSI